MRTTHGSRQLSGFLQLAHGSSAMATVQGVPMRASEDPARLHPERVECSLEYHADISVVGLALTCLGDPKINQKVVGDVTWHTSATSEGPNMFRFLTAWLTVMKGWRREAVKIYIARQMSGVGRRRSNGRSGGQTGWVEVKTGSQTRMRNRAR